MTLETNYHEHPIEDIWADATNGVQRTLTRLSCGHVVRLFARDRARADYQRGDLYGCSKCAQNAHIATDTVVLACHLFGLCDATIDTGKRDVATALQAAERVGWQGVRHGIVCPRHAQAGTMLRHVNYASDPLV